MRHSKPGGYTDDSRAARYGNGVACALAWGLLLAGCAGRPPENSPPASAPDARSLMERSIPPNVTDRAGWSADLYGAFNALTIAPSHENICAVVAVIEQESGFQVDPVIPGLGPIARREIAKRAERAHLPMVLVDGVLQLKSFDGRTYGERIDAAKSEKELSDVYEDFIAAVPLGTTLFAERNPIRTRGPMQVNVVFAEQFSAAVPYPYPSKLSIPDELFTRRGSLYFGIAHLLDYRAPYGSYLYRFADFNAGQYASRNAAFQNALGIVSGMPLATDGALLQGHSRAFEDTVVYRRVFALAEAQSGRLPRAIVPRITLAGPKIKRSLTTDWYAHRVAQRFERCLGAQ